MNVNEEMNYEIDVYFLEANDDGNPFDEPVVKLYYDKYACGMYILPNLLPYSFSVRMYSHCQELLDFLLELWHERRMSELAMKFCDRTGLDGIIKACHFFLMKCSELIDDSGDENQNNDAA